MTVKYLMAHRLDHNNVGDMASQPLQYFLRPHEYQVLDVTDLAASRYDHRLPLILGGGGLLGNAYMGDVAETVLTVPDRQTLQDTMEQASWRPKNKRYENLARQYHDALQDLTARTLERMPVDHGPRYVWGAGHNADVTDSRIKYSRCLAEFRMVGLRDWFGEDSRTRWTPCASCMHPALSRSYDIRNDVIWFEHKKRLIKDFGDDSIPRFINTGNNVEHTIELLGSANIILTNSYHGAYWGTLLGKRVIVVSPWSTKFRHMRFPPTVIQDMRKTSWREAAEQAQIYQDALDICRVATKKFWRDLQENLHQPQIVASDSSLPDPPVQPQLTLWAEPEEPPCE